MDLRDALIIFIFKALREPCYYFVFVVYLVIWGVWGVDSIVCYSVLRGLLG